MKFINQEIKYYHIHLYYTEKNISYAKELGHKIKELFSIDLGRFHEKSVGPHPMWSVQITATRENFYDVMSYAVQNRRDLIFFIHPGSGDDLLAHTDYAIWVGEKQELDISIFKS